MNIESIGTISSQMKKMALNIKWQQRKADPLKEKEENPLIADMKRQAESTRKGNILSSLQSKLLTGTKLTKEEMEYLKENSPEDYEKAVKVERERKEYKKRLEQCRTKEDVERLNQEKLQQFSAEAKAISNNPSIPDEKKRELLEVLCMRVAADMDEHAAFTRTAEYKSLPEDDEDEDKKKARKVKVHSQEEDAFKIGFNAKDPMDVLKELCPELAELSSDGQTADQKTGSVQIYNASGQVSELPTGEIISFQA